MPENGGLGALLAGFAEALESALLRADTRAAERVLCDALTAGLPATLVDDGVVAPAMSSIGDRWASGEISFGDEHVATGIVLRLLALLRDMHRVEQERVETLVVLAAVEGERHVVGLTMAADLLEDAGYDVLFAGADLPAAGLEALLKRHKPALVALTATMPDSAANLRAGVALALDCGVRGVLTGGAIARPSLPPSPSVQPLKGVAGVVPAADGLLRAAGVN